MFKDDDENEVVDVTEDMTVYETKEAELEKMNQSLAELENPVPH